MLETIVVSPTGSMTVSSGLAQSRSFRRTGALQMLPTITSMSVSVLRADLAAGSAMDVRALHPKDLELRFICP
jgi:hypothetical protein